jgi:hypothetical protein
MGDGIGMSTGSGSVGEEGVGMGGRLAEVT